MKKVLAMLMVLSLLVLLAAVLAGCGNGGSETTAPADGGTVDEKPVDEEPVVEGKTFTLAELAEFNGKSGKPAYVAVDGVVYDVTGSAQWPEGDHTPCNLDAMAGRDLSRILDQAPTRMRGYIEARPVVGTLQK